MGLGLHYIKAQKWIGRYAWILIVVAGSPMLTGQDINLSFHHLNEEDGLRPAHEYHIMQDSYSYAWIGTDDGLLRFNGKQFKKYQHDPAAPNSIKENQITSKCFEDALGNLWFTTNQTVSCYRRKEGDFLHFQHGGEQKNYHGFHLDQADRLWLRIGIGALGALYHFDIQDHSFSQIMGLPGAKCYVIENARGEVQQLISTGLPNKPGLSWSDLETGAQKEVHFLFRADSTRRQLSSPTKAAFIEDSSTIWVGLYNGIGRYKIGEQGGLVYIDRNSSIPEDLFFVLDICAYDEQHLLVAAEAGLFLFDKEEGRFVKQFVEDKDNPYSFSLKSPNCIDKYSDGTIWISGTEQEICFAQSQKNRFPLLPSLSGQTITALAEDAAGNIWCSTSNAGCYVFAQDHSLLFRSEELKNKAQGGAYFKLLPISFFISGDDNSWWANSTNYFFNWNKEPGEFEFDFSNFLGIKNSQYDQVNAVKQLRSGKVLFAKGSEIFELKTSPNTIDTIPWHDLRFLDLAAINLIFEDSNGYLYLADVSGRLVILLEKDKQIQKLQDFPNFGIAYGIVEDPIRKVIWSASTKGLAKLNLTDFQYTLLDFNKDKIPDEPFYQLVLDEQGSLWLASNNGLIRYQPDSQAMIRFGQLDGLSTASFSKNAILKASKTGDIWIGGKNGLNVFNPKEIQLLNYKPTVQLSELLVNDEPLDSIRNFNNIEQPLRFRYRDNTLSFKFFAIDFSDPSALTNQFFHQLDKVDPEPVPNQSRGFARYPNLAPGKYTLKIWATNSDQVLNEEAYSLSFVIRTPFHRTIWFYLLCLLAISTIIYAIFQYRLRQALKVERMRVKISSDLHDDVGGLLSGLAMQSEILELTAEETVKPKLQRIAELSRSAMSRMRDTVWAIDARKDKLENLLDRMREHAEETLSPRNFSYQIETDNINLKTNLPTDIRQNLYLIYKEAITNVAKHSKGDQVIIQLSNQAKQFVMSIHDNGQVEEKNYKTTGLGTSNMQMRAEQIGASLDIKQDNGFLIVLQMKAIS